jgi:hypothetical protein
MEIYLYVYVEELIDSGLNIVCLKWNGEDLFSLGTARQ